jgi:hypothetical protein
MFRPQASFATEQFAPVRYTGSSRRAQALVYALLVGIVLIIAYLYTEWVKTRPWAALESAATGRTYLLREDVANIGRPIRELPIIYQVELLPTSISRLHLTIFRNANAIAAQPFRHDGQWRILVLRRNRGARG